MDDATDVTSEVIDKVYLEQCLALLSPEDRELLVRHANGETYTALAKDYGYANASGVRKRIERIKKQITPKKPKARSKAITQNLRIALNTLYDRYHKPLFIVENGIGWADVLEEDNSVHDSYRIDYLRQNVQSMKDAVLLDGIPLMGYTMWGCIDLVSAGTGEMKKRYGFVYVDMDDLGNGTMKRYKKDSFYWYKKMIASDGEDLD